MGLRDSSKLLKSDEMAAEEAADKAKPRDTMVTHIKRFSKWSGLDWATLKKMFKGSLPPIIALAMQLSPPVSAVYSTTGTMVAIAALNGMAISPRGMFIQNLVLISLSICVAAAAQLLALYTSIVARNNTAAPDDSPTGYNSSACAVLAIWMFVQVYLTNTLRAKLPQFQFPVFLYMIYAIVSLTTGSRFATMAAVIQYQVRLLRSFLTGFALAAGVHFVVFPTSSRGDVMSNMKKYLNLISDSLEAQAELFDSLEKVQPEDVRKTRGQRDQTGQKDVGGEDVPPLLANTAEGLRIREVHEKLLSLQSGIPNDVKFAKREPAIGKISADDLEDAWENLRPLFVPIMGLNAVLDILQRRAWMVALPDANTLNDSDRARDHAERMHKLVHALREPLDSMTTNIQQAIKHVLLVLQLEKPDKKSKERDEESTGDAAPPGTPGFAAGFKMYLDEFLASKSCGAKEWCHEDDIALSLDCFTKHLSTASDKTSAKSNLNKQQQRQLFFVLYVEHLLWRAGCSALDLVMHVDQKKQDGAISRFPRLLLPTAEVLQKWCKIFFVREEMSMDGSYIVDASVGAKTSIYLGESYNEHPDPEHLPPRNAIEKCGHLIRSIPEALRSDASAFGFRVAVAVMSVAIMCYIKQTHTFFLDDRVLWGVIMIPFAMTAGAGQSMFNFILRLVGSVIAIIGAYIVWYVVVGKVPGVIVLLWFWIFCGHYILIKRPKLLIVGIISIITILVIIGYELEVGVVGIQRATQNGQPAYPTYLLAPIRLLAVVGGITVAYIWTVFPYPIAPESTELRKKLGGSIFALANLYSITHETIRACAMRTCGDFDKEGTRGYHLEKARHDHASNLIDSIQGLREASSFSKVQLHVGGPFRQRQYEELVARVEGVFENLVLLSHAAKTFSMTDRESKWSSDFRNLLASSETTSHQTTSLLSLLSASMITARPLPPYVEVPQPLRLARKLDSIDHEILSVQHIAEPEYGAFAVMTIASQGIHEDLVDIVKLVKALVGEIDFSFHSDDDASLPMHLNRQSSEDTVVGNDGRGEKGGKSS